MESTIKRVTVIVSAIAGIIFIACGVVMLVSAMEYYTALGEVVTDTPFWEMIRNFIESCGLYFGFGITLLCISGVAYSSFELPEE